MKRLATVLAAAVMMTGSAVMAADTPSVFAALPANANFADGLQSDATGIVSVRNTTNPPMAITPADTYDGILLGQSTAGAAFITNSAGRVNTHTFDLAQSQHGTLVANNAVINISESQTVTGPDSIRIVVSVFTADATDLWTTGVTIGGVAMTQGRFDVGGPVTGFTNGLLWDNIPGPITNLSITNAVLDNGVVLATSPVLTNNRTLPEMGTAVVWNGVVGSGVDESQMIFNITYAVPEPASLGALGLVGIGAFARRRRS